MTIRTAADDAGGKVAVVITMPTRMRRTVLPARPVVPVTATQPAPLAGVAGTTVTSDGDVEMMVRPRATRNETVNYIEGLPEMMVVLLLNGEVVVVTHNTNNNIGVHHHHREGLIMMVAGIVVANGNSAAPITLVQVRLHHTFHHHHHVDRAVEKNYGEMIIIITREDQEEEGTFGVEMIADLMVETGVIETSVDSEWLVQTRRHLRAASQTIVDEVDRGKDLVTVSAKAVDEVKKLLVAVAEERNAPEMVREMNVTEIETGQNQSKEIDATEIDAGMIKIEMVGATQMKSNRHLVMSPSRMSSGAIKRQRPRQIYHQLQLLSATKAVIRIREKWVKLRLRKEKKPRLLFKIPRKMIRVPLLKMPRKRKPRKPEMLNQEKVQVSKIQREKEIPN
jgi:hypothetical protein